MTVWCMSGLGWNCNVTKGQIRNILVIYQVRAYYVLNMKYETETLGLMLFICFYLIN